MQITQFSLNVPFINLIDFEIMIPFSLLMSSCHFLPVEINLSFKQHSFLAHALADFCSCTYWKLISGNWIKLPKMCCLSCLYHCWYSLDLFCFFFLLYLFTYLFILFFADEVVKISVGFLVILFSVQRFGTSKVGLAVGPALFIWFCSLGGIGIYNLMKYGTTALRAFNPVYIYYFFERNTTQAWMSLGGCLLCATGTFVLTYCTHQ